MDTPRDPIPRVPRVGGLRVRGPWTVRGLLVALASAAVATACRSAPRPEPQVLALSAGVLGIADGEQSSRYGAEVRFGEHTSWKLIPAVSLAWSDDGAFFVSTEARRNFWVSERFILTPSFGVGYFDAGKVLDLGGDLEFRSALEATYCFGGDWRLGLVAFHISNAGIFAANPGTEGLALTIAIPLPRTD